MTFRPYLIGALLGFGLAAWLFRDAPAVVEVAAPAIPLPGGGVVAERVPEAPLPPVAAEAARELGGTVARAGSVTVQPRTPDAAPSETPAAGSAVPVAPCLCKPLTLDWSLIGLNDGTYRMAVDSPDGTIISATDTPVLSFGRRDETKWAAGVKASTLKEYGVWVDRDWRRIRYGVEVEQRKDYGVVGWAKLGIRF